MKTVNMEEFLRSFKVIPQQKMGIFLGSGCSIQAGIPSGNQLTWEFKRSIYCSDKKLNEERFKDLDLERNKNLLQEYFDLKGDYPQRGDSHEYSFYFEKCFPEPQHRRLFLKQRIVNKKPTLGHKCLGALVANQKISKIFTTNFDDLIEKGIAESDSATSCITYSEDNRSFPNSEHDSLPWIIKLHGDYLYDSLQNTTSELKSLEQRFHQYIGDFASNSGMIVVGYSGADNSIISALEDSLHLEKPFPSGFYWTMRKGDSINERVSQLIKKLSEKNNLVGILEIDHFDEFAYDLVVSCQYSNEKIEASHKQAQKIRPFDLTPGSQASISPIKLNAFKSIVIPTHYYRFKSKIVTWRELKGINTSPNIIAGLFKGQVFCFGDIQDIKDQFKDNIQSEITIQDISSNNLKRLNSVELGMIYELINRSLEKNFNLKCVSYQDRIFYSEKHKLSTQELTFAKILDSSFGNLTYEAFEYSLEFVNETIYFVLHPTVHIEKTGAHKDISNKILSSRYNKNSAEKLSLWNKILSQGSSSIEFNFPTATCKFDSTSSYADINSSSKVDYFEKINQLPEPKLIFHSTDRSYSSEHPLKGLHSFGPYDLSLGSSPESLKIAVICPKNDLNKINNFFNELNTSSTPKSEKEYLIEYQSFAGIFKRRIEVPNSSDSPLFSDLSVKMNISIEEFYSEIKRRIDQLSLRKNQFDLLVVYIPDYWSKFREKKTDDVYFDLHDSVKIYGAKKYIGIQFMNDKSMRYFDRTKVKWWLSLALYAKSGGVPWVTTGDETTVYVGLSHAVSRGRDKRVTIGMSQIFDSKGRGTRFLVSPINRPIYIGRNPYMSKEDSRRLMHTLKETYFKMDSNAEIKKLVIHKSSPFIRDEIEGFLQATEGIDLELLHIQQYPMWRGIKGDRKQKTVAAYPVNRGTIIQLDDYSLLLFSHGSIQNSSYLNSNNNYFRGARGIPAPLKITRYAGNDSAEKIGAEILRLTKMNWNGGEIYKNLPVTIDFSRFLSKYSKQDELLLNIPYDFRYFI